MKKEKITPLKWILIFSVSIIIGIILYLIMVKIIFNPDLIVTPKVALQILTNLGNPALKLKAYIAFFALILPYLISLIWFFMPQFSPKENYGNARFAEKKDFEEMNISNNKGLILGCLIKKSLNSKIEMEYIRAKMPFSALVVAPPGTGKTSGIILPNLFTIPNSTIVLDIKGELFTKSAGYRQKNFNNQILLFEPFSDRNTLFFNPFDNSIIKDMDFIQMMKLADQIAGTIFVGEKGKENDHWVTSAKSLFTFFALYNMQKHKHTSLGDLTQAPKKDYFDELNEEFGQECLTEDEDTGEVKRDYNVDTFKVFLKQVANDKEIDEIVRNQARAYQTAAEQEFASIKSTYDTFMKVFTNPQVANATSKMNFTFDSLREKKITMYVVIQTEDMDILAPLVRIFIESLFKKLMSGKENSDPDKFIYCLLDEFVRFGKMPFLLESPALCRSYGLIPVFVTQSYEQIRKYYGEDDLGIIRANAGYQTIFRMNTEKDAKEISDLIGDFTREKVSSSKGNFDFFKSNNTISNEGYKLVTSQDIKNQSSEDILILVTGFLSRPIKAKVPYWFKNPSLKDADKIALETKEQEEEVKDDINNNPDSENDENQNKQDDLEKNTNFDQSNQNAEDTTLEQLGIRIKRE